MIRRAEIQDSKSIAQIRIDGWKTAYKGIIPDSHLDKLDYNREEEIVKRRINGQYLKFKYDILVYEENDKVIAYSWYGKSLDERYQGEVVAIYVMPSEKGRGIGTKLINKIKLEFKNIGYKNMIIWCLKDNYPSIKFYEKLGGKIKEEREFVVDGVNVFEVGLVYEI